MVCITEITLPGPMRREACANAFESRLSVDTKRFAAIIRRDAPVDFCSLLCRDFRFSKFSAGQTLFQNIRQVCSVLWRECQRLQSKLFTSSH